MARSLEAALAGQFGGIALTDMQDILDLSDRGADAASFDPSYGDTLPDLLPSLLSDLVVTRH
jgi:hypothetical protein